MVRTPAMPGLPCSFPFFALISQRLQRVLTCCNNNLSYLKVPICARIASRHHRPRRSNQLRRGSRLRARCASAAVHFMQKNTGFWHSDFARWCTMLVVTIFTVASGKTRAALLCLAQSHSGVCVGGRSPADAADAADTTHDDADVVDDLLRQSPPHLHTGPRPLIFTATVVLFVCLPGKRTPPSPSPYHNQNRNHRIPALNRVLLQLRNPHFRALALLQLDHGPGAPAAAWSTPHRLHSQRLSRRFSLCGSIPCYSYLECFRSRWLILICLLRAQL